MMEKRRGNGLCITGEGIGDGMGPQVRDWLMGSDADDWVIGTG